MTRRHAGRARRRVASHRARNGGPRDGVQGVRARGAVGNRRWRAFRGARRVSRAALARVSDGRRRDRARLVERTDGDFGCSRGRDDAGAVVLARVRRLGWSRARASRRRAFSSGRRARGSARAPRGGALARARQPRVASRPPRRADGHVRRGRPQPRQPRPSRRRRRARLRVPPPHAHRRRLRRRRHHRDVALGALRHRLFRARRPERSRAVELATLGLSITFVTLGGRYVDDARSRTRTSSTPPSFAASKTTRVFAKSSARALRAPSSVVAATSGGEWIWQRRYKLASWPRWRAHKIHLAFPLVGTKKTGMVTVEANKVRAGYAYKTIVVDVAASDGGEHRVHLAGPRRVARRRRRSVRRFARR